MIFPENSSFTKIWKEWRIIYVEMFSRLWKYLAEFFLEREMFQAKVVEKIKTRILGSVTFSPKIVPSMGMAKHMVEPKRPQMTIHDECALNVE